MSSSRYQDFRSALRTRLMALDGSMGALLQRRGLPAGHAPDLWNLENPDVIRQVHREYAEAGADILITNTFGASRLRLNEYNAYGKLKEVNQRAVALAQEGSRGKCFIAGDIGPCGDTIFPTGKRSFDEIFELFREQVSVLVSEGADLLIIETMFDSLDLKAALSAARDVSRHIPIIALMTFNTDGISDTGISPESAVAIAEGFHADVVGANCSVGPQAMLNAIKRMKPLSPLPLCAQPNAGLPVLKNGQTVFPMDAHAMSEFILPFFQAGVRLLGGCCGTTPEYVRKVRHIIEEHPELAAWKTDSSPRVLISSKMTACQLGGNAPFVMIGEKINPTGRKKVAEHIRAGNIEALMLDATLQANAGARCLDVNVGVPLIDEPEMMATTIVALQNAVDLPLVIDSSFSTALEKGGKVYYGRPLLNSINAEDEKLEEVIPIARKVGGAMLALTTATEVPEKAEDRLKYAQKILDRLLAEGFTKNDVVFDVLGLTVSAMPEASRETLRTIELITQELGCATTLGLSNVSFGLPNRRFVHQSFLMMALPKGLSSAIMSVTERDIAPRIAAASLFTRREGTTSFYLEKFSLPIPESGGETAMKNAPSPSDADAEPDIVKKMDALEKQIFWAIAEGQKQALEDRVQDYIKTRSDTSFELFLHVMTPAIRHLGDLFGQRKRFIPHLVAAAEAMKTGVKILEPYLAARKKEGERKATIIFATVKGDIHDIGKNICVLMLKNFGYEVIDLGRNIPMETIFEAARKHEAQIIALSALMTTTMIQMKLLIEENRRNGYGFQIMIGGAPVTSDFAQEIGADSYSPDVGSIVDDTELVLKSLGFKEIGK